MNRIVIDETTKAKLGNLEAPAELCDDSGRVLARLTPVRDSDIYSTLQSPHSDEELRRRANEQETYSTADLLERLEQL